MPQKSPRTLNVFRHLLVRIGSSATAWFTASFQQPVSHCGCTRLSRGPLDIVLPMTAWSEEPPPRGFQKLLDNSGLIPIFGVKEQWFQWSIVLECGGQAAFHSDIPIQNQVITFPTKNRQSGANREGSRPPQRRTDR